MVFECDAEGRLTYVSPNIEGILGYKPEEVLGQGPVDFMLPEEREEKFEKGFRVASASREKIKAMEIAYLHKDGSRIVLEVNATPFLAADGTLLGFRGVYRDITERKKMEELLRRRDRELRDAQRIGKIGNWSMDLETSLDLGDSEEFRRIFGVDPSGPMPPWLETGGLFFEPKDWERANNAMQNALQTGEGFEIDVPAKRLDGTPIWVTISSEAVRDSLGNVTVLHGTVQDITERKRLENFLMVANYKLEQRDASRTVELERANKSLRAEIEERKQAEAKLLAAQKGLRAMASETALAEERSRRQFAADLHDTVVQTLGAAKMRAELIEDLIPDEGRAAFSDLKALLSESILQARSVMTEMSPPALNELGIASALEWLTQQIGHRYGMAMDFRGGRSRKPLALSRDIELLLFHAARELLMNVAKHSSADQVKVRFSSQGRRVRVEVIDNGSGFDIKKTLQPDLKGGFGLYSIRERLRHVGGQLTIKSKPGQGTTVLITAPREIEK